MNYCLPSDFKYETIDKYQEINERYAHGKVFETYGQITQENPFGSCRYTGDLPQIDLPGLEKYIQYSYDKGIDFNYVINATCMSNEELTGDGFRKICTFLKQLETIGVQWITVSLPSLMEIAQYAAPSLNIKASTVCQINSPLKAKFYKDIGAKRIVLDEDIYRRFDILESIRKVYTGDMEVIVNSICINDCPLKMFHYNSFSHSHITDDSCSYYTSRCRSSHTSAENFLKINWIRPEDIPLYTNSGIHFFKLQGRTNVFTGDPARAVTHYIERHYDGNLIALLELFSSYHPLTIADLTVDNRKLDCFLQPFKEDPLFCSKVCSACGYCRSYAVKSINSADLAMLDFMEIMKGVADGMFIKRLEQSNDPVSTAATLSENSNADPL